MSIPYTKFKKNFFERNLILLIILAVMLFLTGGFGFLDISYKSKVRLCEEWKKDYHPREHKFVGSFFRPFQKIKGDKSYCQYLDNFAEETDQN